MARRIYIVSAMDVNTAADAATNNCPEIVIGIPPILQAELNGVSLPHVYQEPEPFVDPCPCAYIRSIDGAPAAVPLINEGLTPLLFDAANARLYAYVNGVWKFAQFS